MIVAGFGFTTRASATSLSSALAQTHSLTRQRPDRLATAADKTRTAAFGDFAQRMHLPVSPIEEDELVAMQTQTQSAHSLTTRGSGSVAEAAALAAAGRNARLLTGRTISDDHQATCAIAEGDGP